VLAEYQQSGPRTYRNVDAVTTTVLSALVGIALDEGSLRSVDQPLEELLPRDAAQLPARLRGTTLEQLLTMTAGMNRVWWGVDDPTLGRVTGPHPLPRLFRAADQAPGSFAFSNADAHVVAAVLQEATGTPLLAFAREKLFDPLGIDTRPASTRPVRPGTVARYQRTGFAWPTDSEGVNTGWGLLRLRPVDVAKLGLLYLQDGRWKGRQLVPRDWVEASTTARVATTDMTNRYGYLWWLGTADGVPAYVGIGAGGQLLEVVPDRDLVVVVLSEYDLSAPSAAGVTDEPLLSLVDDVIAPRFRL
jgi:CubicO group peptidase (beta-lactamase class C family)